MGRGKNGWPSERGGSLQYPLLYTIGRPLWTGSDERPWDTKGLGTGWGPGDEGRTRWWQVARGPTVFFPHIQDPTAFLLHLDTSPAGFEMTGTFPPLPPSWCLLNKELTSPCCVRILTLTTGGRGQGHHDDKNEEMVLFFLLWAELLMRSPPQSPGRIPTTHSTLTQSWKVKPVSHLVFPPLFARWPLLIFQVSLP